LFVSLYYADAVSVIDEHAIGADRIKTIHNICVFESARWYGDILLSQVAVVEVADRPFKARIQPSRGTQWVLIDT